MKPYGVILICAVGIQIGILFLLGQPWISASGIVSIWEGRVFSPENSQQLSDWYTFSHIIHGFLFYGILSYFFPRLTLRTKFILAVGAEVGWELLENSPLIINRYRETALALGYSGDSIINSVSDVIAMTLGFLVAYRAPLMVSILLILSMELGVMYAIRDNLTLNIVNLLHPFPALQLWQQGL